MPRLSLRRITLVSTIARRRTVLLRLWSVPAYTNIISLPIRIYTDIRQLYIFLSISIYLWSVPVYTNNTSLPIRIYTDIRQLSIFLSICIWSVPVYTNITSLQGSYLSNIVFIFIYLYSYGLSQSNYLLPIYLYIFFITIFLCYQEALLGCTFCGESWVNQIYYRKHVDSGECKVPNPVIPYVCENCGQGKNRFYCILFIIMLKNLFYILLTMM